jgi:hypothetical protein
MIRPSCPVFFLSPPPSCPVQLAADAARQAVTLLANSPPGSPGALPWSAAALAGKRVCVLGPLANLSLAHMGSYAPTVPLASIVSPAAGISAALGGVPVSTLAGCTDQTACTQLDPALAPLAATCDAIVAVLGTSAVATEEAEEEGALLLQQPQQNADSSTGRRRRQRRYGASGGCTPQDAHEQEGCDRSDVLFPGQQLALLQVLSAAANASGAPLVLVIASAGMIDLSVPAANPAVKAIIRAPYLAQFVGTALADVIFGAFNPSGRLTLTFYAPPYTNALPAITNYSMAGRTYRYYDGKPLYEFGFGLSYTTWSYAAASVPAQVAPCDVVSVTSLLANTGGRAGAEVAQLYLSLPNATVPLVPRMQLVAFDKVALGRGESALLNLTITPEASSVLREGDFEPVIEPGLRVLWLGSSSGRSRPGVAAVYEVVGETVPLSACATAAAGAA